LAAAMGVPGILTMGFRAASNKFGVDAVNAFLADANQKMVARGGGIDLTKPGGVAAAASQIDQLGQIPGSGGTFAAKAGADGTGGRAADVGSYVSQRLQDVGSGLTDAQLANASQAAVNAVISGKSMDEAITIGLNAAAASVRENSGGEMGDSQSIIDRIMTPPGSSDLSGENYDGNFGDMMYDINPANIGFDYGSFDSIDFETSMPQTKSTPKSEQKEEEGNGFYDYSYRTRQVLAQMEDILGRKQSFEQ
jgi:hypothetical protein